MITGTLASGEGGKQMSEFDQREAVKLLQEALRVILKETNQAEGEDHPVLRMHRITAKRISNFLSRVWKK